MDYTLKGKCWLLSVKYLWVLHWVSPLRLPCLTTKGKQLTQCCSLSSKYKSCQCLVYMEKNKHVTSVNAGIFYSDFKSLCTVALELCTRPYTLKSVKSLFSRQQFCFVEQWMESWLSLAASPFLLLWVYVGSGSVLTRAHCRLTHLHKALACLIPTESYDLLIFSWIKPAVFIMAACGRRGRGRVFNITDVPRELYLLKWRSRSGK